MRRVALLIVFLGAALLYPRTTLAANIPTQAGITVSCECTDSTSKAYGAAIQELLNSDPDFKALSAKSADAEGPMNIRITSKALPAEDGVARVALTVLYRHGGKFMQQTLQTCTRIPLQMNAAMLVRDVKELESEPNEIADSDAPNTNEVLTASAR